MTPPLDETPFTWNGQVYKAKEKFGCSECAFVGMRCDRFERPSCTAHSRADKKSVIFIKLGLRDFVKTAVK